MRTLGLIVLGAILILLIGALGLWLAHRAPDLPSAELERRFARPASHYTTLPGGIRIHYLDEGPADAPPVVLVHGFGDNSFSWDGWAQVLRARYHVLRVDLPGHGLTEAPADYRLAPDALADTLAAWAEAIHLQPAALAGNSLGGAVAWQLAVRHPDRVSRLILVDAAGWPAPPSKSPPPLAFRIMRYKAGRALLASIDNTPLIRSGLKGEVGNPAVITDALVTRWAALQRAPGHRTILMSLGAGAAPASPALLASVRVPTLILWGQRDPLIPVADAERFRQAIAHATVVTYPGVGHLPQLEVPERSAGDAAAFLARTDAP